MDYQPELKYWMILASEKCTNDIEHYYIMHKSSQGFFSVSNCFEDMKRFMKNNMGCKHDKIISLLTLGPGYCGSTLDYNLTPQDSLDNNPDFDTMCDLFPWMRYTVYKCNVCENKQHFTHICTSTVPFESSYQCYLAYTDELPSFINECMSSYITYKIIV